MWTDLDGDNLGDSCDSQDDRDTDQDGLLNYQDNCVDVANESQQDHHANRRGER